MAIEHHNSSAGQSGDSYTKSRRGGNAPGRPPAKRKPVRGSPMHLQRVTLEDLRNSKERVMLQKLQRKIALAPPTDRHPPTRLGDFLPDWFETNVTKSSDLLAIASETLRAVLPMKLLRTITLGPLQRGQLTVYCSSSTAKMELDMLLRAATPGLRQLQTATKGLIFKVKTMVHREYTKG